MTILRVNGCGYFVEERGAGDPLFLLHGFTGSADSWAKVAGDLASRYRIIAVDLIGHGRSDAPSDAGRYAFRRVIDDLAEISMGLGVSHASWLGYSMGGRAALGLALWHPGLVGRLLLESASPGVGDPAARTERRAADHVLADSIENHGVEAFVDEWERHPLWRSQVRLLPETKRRQREIRLGNVAAGLAGSLRGMGAGAQPSLWPRIGEVESPTLLIAGALDTKFAGIAAHMADQIPHGTLAIVPHAGHAAHLEQPKQFTALVEAFISPAG